MLRREQCYFVCSSGVAWVLFVPKVWTNLSLHTLSLSLQRLGECFAHLSIPSVLVAAMDVTEEIPPPELMITIPSLPALLLFPGNDKGPPYR